MWGSLGMNLDQRGKCVCGGCRVPVLGGPDTFSFLASASHPWVQPACQSLGSTRRVSSRGWKHTHRSPRRAKSQGFLQEERKLEQEEEPPEAGEPQGPARQQGRPAGQQGVQRGRCCQGLSSDHMLGSHLSLYVCAASSDLSCFPDLGCLACCSAGRLAGPPCLPAWTQEGEVKLGAWMARGCPPCGPPPVVGGWPCSWNVLLHLNKERCLKSSNLPGHVGCTSG